MAIFKDGYNGEPLEIRVNSHFTGKAEIWTDMFDSTKYSEYEIPRDDIHDKKFRTEVLHYAELTELVAFRDEINAVLKEMVGV